MQRKNSPATQTDADQFLYFISIVIPVFNAEKSIGLCLQALTRQTLSRAHYEIIVVNDGSTDKTAHVTQQYDVIYFSQENKGPAAARNKGVTLASNKNNIFPANHLIFFTDADCVPDPDWLEAMALPFTDPDVAAVKGTYRTEQTSITARFAQYEFEERYAMLKKAESIDMIDTYCAGFRKKVFLQLGGFDTRFPVANNEDTELSYRMADQGFIMQFAPGAVVRHLNHPDSIIRYFRLKCSRGYWRMVVYRMFPHKMIRDSYTPQLLKVQIAIIFTLCVLALLLPFFSVAAKLILPLLLLFGATTLPFTIMVLKKDYPVGILSPLLLALRALALGSGVLFAMVEQHFTDHPLSKLGNSQ